MKVSELIEFLQTLPQNLPVVGYGRDNVLFLDTSMIEVEEKNYYGNYLISKDGAVYEDAFVMINPI